MIRKRKVFIYVIMAIATGTLIIAISMYTLILAYSHNVDSEQADLTVEVERITEIPTKSYWVELPVPYLNQYPELPTGCEITSLTAVLNYLGYPVLKETMADNYLPKCDLNEGDFINYFLGDPRNENAYGCYASPIVTAANSYLDKQKSAYRAYNYSGNKFETFLKEIDEGTPVILWSTINLAAPQVSGSWTVNGKDLSWMSPEHCVVLIGYDVDSNMVKIADPQKGIITCSMSIVKMRYEQMSNQAVVIKK